MDEQKELERLQDEIKALKKELEQDVQVELCKIKSLRNEVSLELKEWIIKNPLQSFAIAFCAGVLLSKVCGKHK